MEHPQSKALSRAKEWAAAHIVTLGVVQVDDAKVKVDTHGASLSNHASAPSSSCKTNRNIVRVSPRKPARSSKAVESTPTKKEQQSAAAKSVQKSTPKKLKEGKKSGKPTHVKKKRTTKVEAVSSVSNIEKFIHREQPRLSDEDRRIKGTQALDFPKGWMYRRIREGKRGDIRTYFYSPKLKLKFRGQPDALLFLSVMERTGGNEEEAVPIYKYEKNLAKRKKRKRL